MRDLRRSLASASFSNQFQSFLHFQVARVATYPQRVTLATVLACVVWGGVAIPECSVDILGVDKVILF